VTDSLDLNREEGQKATGAALKRATWTQLRIMRALPFPLAWRGEPGGPD
jgi:hypothetical protein